MAKIFVVGADFQFEENEILAAAQKHGFDAEFVVLGDFEIRLGEKTKFCRDGIDFFSELSGDERFVIRRSRKQFEKLVAFVEILQKRNFIFTDSFRAVVTNLNKEIFLPTIESKIFPHPPNSFFTEKSQKISVKNLKFPMISKPVLGRHGEGILIHENFESLRKTIDVADGNLIVQDFLDIDFEFRIFVIGHAVLGAVRKIPEPGKKIANYAAGAKFEKIDLPKKFYDEAVKLCAIQEIDIGGIDVVRTKSGEHFLLEINRCPEFKAFSAATKIDVASKIIEFIAQK